MSSDAKEVLKEVLPKVARLRASCPVRRSLLHTQLPPRVCVCIIRDRCLIVLERPCWLAGRDLRASLAAGGCSRHVCYAGWPGVQREGQSRRGPVQAEAHSNQVARAPGARAEGEGASRRASCSAAP